MNENDRDVLGGIARSLRRYLGREEAAGRGELLAASARAASRRTAKATNGGEPLIVPRPDTTVIDSGKPAAPGGGPAKRAPEPAPVAVDLFGEPIREPVGSSDPGAEIDFDFVPARAPLNPWSDAERAVIESESRPLLDEVAREARVCTLCGLCETRTQAVPGVGSARSGIVFVGEAPGAEEDRQGEPFVGRAGELLTRIIKAMDEARLIPGVPLSREAVYICNVLKCRPPENRNPLPHEVESCSPYLTRQLEALKPRIICCLGKFAAELLVGAKGTIAALRGRTYRYQGAKLIVTYHPAACLRNPNLKRPVWEDMQLLAREYVSD